MRQVVVLALIALFCLSSVEAGRKKRQTPAAIQLNAQGGITDNENMGTFNLVSLASTKAIDVYGGGQADGTRLILYRTNGGKNQKWTFWRNSENYYYIQAVHSGKVIDVNGASKQQGVVMFQWPYHGGANQQWQLIGANGKVLDFKSGDDSTSPRANWMFIKNRNSGLVLDVYGASRNDETNIIQWPQKSSGTENQQWAVVQD